MPGTSPLGQTRRRRRRPRATSRPSTCRVGGDPAVRGARVADDVGGGLADDAVRRRGELRVEVVEPVRLDRHRQRRCPRPGRPARSARRPARARRARAAAGGATGCVRRSSRHRPRPAGGRAARDRPPGRCPSGCARPAARAGSRRATGRGRRGSPGGSPGAPRGVRRPGARAPAARSAAALATATAAATTDERSRSVVRSRAESDSPGTGETSSCPTCSPRCRRSTTVGGSVGRPSRSGRARRRRPSPTRAASTGRCPR